MQRRLWPASRMRRFAFCSGKTERSSTRLSSWIRIPIDEMWPKSDKGSGWSLWTHRWKWWRTNSMLASLRRSRRRTNTRWVLSFELGLAKSLWFFSPSETYLCFSTFNIACMIWVWFAWFGTGGCEAARTAQREVMADMSSHLGSKGQSP